MTDDDFYVLWKNMVERSHRPHSAPLSDDEMVFYAVNLLRGSVPRSGFAGYFENCTASEILAAHRGLRILGLETAMGLLNEAQSIVLRGRPLPDEPVSLNLYPDSANEAECQQISDGWDESLDPIEAEFYPLCDEIYQSLCSYAAACQLKPKNPTD